MLLSSGRRLILNTLVGEGREGAFFGPAVMFHDSFSFELEFVVVRQVPSELFTVQNTYSGENFRIKIICVSRKQQIFLETA